MSLPIPNPYQIEPNVVVRATMPQCAYRYVVELKVGSDGSMAWTVWSRIHR